MPKIKNYSPYHEEEPYGGYKWKHDEKENVVVEVTKNIANDNSIESSLWRVKVWDYAHCYELGPISNNKENMREVAVKWMEDNPQGWNYENS